MSDLQHAFWSDPCNQLNFWSFTTLPKTRTSRQAFTMSKFSSYNNAFSDAPPEYPQNSQAPSQGFSGPPSNAGYYGYDPNATQGQQFNAGGGPPGQQFPGQNQQHPMPPPQQAGPNQQYNPPSHYGAGAAYPGMAVCAHSDPHSCLHIFTEISSHVKTAQSMPNGAMPPYGYASQGPAAYPPYNQQFGQQPPFNQQPSQHALGKGSGGASGCCAQCMPLFGGILAAG